MTDHAEADATAETPLPQITRKDLDGLYADALDLGLLVGELKKRIERIRNGTTDDGDGESGADGEDEPQPAKLYFG
jgi:hypothetical protein